MVDRSRGEVGGRRYELGSIRLAKPAYRLAELKGGLEPASKLAEPT